MVSKVVFACVLFFPVCCHADWDLIGISKAGERSPGLYTSVIDEYNLSVPAVLQQSLLGQSRQARQASESRQTGRVFFAVGSRIVAAHFVKFEDRSDFDQYLDAYARSRGPKTRIEGSASRKVLITEPYSPAPGMQMKVEDEFVKYANGFGLFGQKEVFEAPMEGVATALRGVKNREYFHFVRLAGIPPNLRESFLQTYIGSSSVAVQQRDGEPDRKYKSRRLVADGFARLTMLLLDGIDSIKLTGSSAEDGRMESRISVSLKPNAQLKAYIANARPHRAKLQLDHTATILVAVANATLAPKARQAINDLLSTAELPRWLIVFLRSVVQERMEVAGWIGLKEENWQATLESPLSTEPAATDTQVQVVGPYRLKSGTVGKMAILQATDKSFDVPLQSRQTASGGLLSESWLTLNVDLSPLIGLKPTAPARQALATIERLYDRVRYALLFQADLAATVDSDSFTSVARAVNREGDWSGALKVQGGPDRLLVRIRLGKDLHRLLIARDLMTSSRIVQGRPTAGDASDVWTRSID